MLYFIEVVANICTIGVTFYAVREWFNLKDRNKIQRDLEKYKKIGPQLSDYVQEYKRKKDLDKRNKNLDAGIRFVSCKDYGNYTDGAYKHILNINHNDETWSTPINEHGIIFKEQLWFYNASIYVGKNNIFFIAKSGGTYKGFEEHINKRIEWTLPFTSIAEVDFINKIEYEPIFYLYNKSYQDYFDLCSPNLFVREKYGEDFFNLELNKKNRLKQYSLLSYWFLRFGLLIKIFYINLKNILLFKRN